MFRYRLSVAAQADVIASGPPDRADGSFFDPGAAKKKAPGAFVAPGALIFLIFWWALSDSNTRPTD
jgi:hypothetical protein